MDALNIGCTSTCHAATFFVLVHLDPHTDRCMYLHVRQSAVEYNASLFLDIIQLRKHEKTIVTMSHDEGEIRGVNYYHRVRFDMREQVKSVIRIESPRARPSAQPFLVLIDELIMHADNLCKPNQSSWRRM